MATTHNFSAFANSLVRPPIDPKTGLAATLDKRYVTQHLYETLNSGKYEDSAPVVDARAYSRAQSEQLVPPRDDYYSFFDHTGDVPDDFYGVLTQMKEENKKSLEISEKLYENRHAEYDNLSEPTQGFQSSAENLSDVKKSATLDDQQLKKNKEMVKRIIAAGIKSSGIATTGKPPSGKPKTSDGLPAKSGAPLTKSLNRTWAERVRASEPYWRAPQSRASSDFDISEVERYKDYLISLTQSETFKPVDDIWESYSFAEHEPQSHSKVKGMLFRSSSMSRLPTSKNDVMDRSCVDTWKNRVTVPQPFSMTLREANRTPRKSKVAIEVEQKKAEKQLEEELECQKKFKATPPPAHIYVPMFQEIMEGQESKRQMIHENGEELLKSLQEPFEFVLREEEKHSQRRRTMSASVSRTTSHAQFKANPFPSHIFDNSVTARMAEEEEYRRIRAKLRSKELMRSARLPSSMDERDKDYFAGRSRQRERVKKASKSGLVVEPSFRPKVNKAMPDFDERYKKFLASLKKKPVPQTTVCKPFKLESSKLALKKRRTLEENAKWETARENSSSQKSIKSRPLSKFITGLLSTSLDSIPTKMTHAAELRTSLTKLKLQKMEEKQTAEVREKQQKLLKEKILKQVVATRSAAVDTSMHMQGREEILKTKIEAEKERSASYRKQLNEMKKRLQERPLLFEQIAERNARMAAERKYHATLSKSGLNVEYLSKKSSSDVAGSISAHEAEDLGIHDDQIHDDGLRDDSPRKDDSPPVSDRRSGLGSRPSSGRMSERSAAKSVEEDEEEVVTEDDASEKDYADDFGGSEKQSDDDDDELVE